MTQPVTKLLVICGATSPSESWLFGTFLGICRALKLLDMEGDFWSCFPIHEHFNTHDSIKFGTRGTTGQTPEEEQEFIEIYTKADFDRGERFWEQIAWDRVSDDVLSYVESQAKKLAAGDVFSTILIGHGTEEGTRIGDKILRSEDLAKALDGFIPGVKVNVVVQSCDAGVFMDKISVKEQRRRFVHTSSSSIQTSPSGRFRNSVFSGAFLRSLGFAMSSGTTAWTLDGRINFLKPGAMTNSQRSTFDSALITKFMDVLFTDFVDRGFSQTTTATNVARRIITPSAPMTDPSRPTPNIPYHHLQDAAECITAEIDLADDEGGEQDAALIQALSVAKYFFFEKKTMSVEVYRQHLAAIVKALAWRFRIQEYFYLAMEGLANKDLVDPDLAFRHPIYFLGPEADPRVRVIVEVLQSFELVQKSGHPDPGEMEGRFDSPIWWLATVLVRSSTDLKRSLSFLMTTGLLGKVDLKYVDGIEREDVDITQPLHPSTVESVPQIGFWLPQGGDRSAGGNNQAALVRYQRIKTIFEQFFGKGSWGIDDLIQDSSIFMVL